MALAFQFEPVVAFLPQAEKLGTPIRKEEIPKLRSWKQTVQN